MWSGLIGQWPSQKICQALRLTCKVSNRSEFNFYKRTIIFYFTPTCKVYLCQFSHRNLWILFFQTLNYNQEELSPQHFQRVGNYGQYQSCWTNSPKSPCNSMGPSYFDIRTPVFKVLTLDSTYIKFEYVKWSTYIKFEYVFRVICSKKTVRKLKVCK